ncbi:MAG: tetratricopeptide repeat protein [Paracoccaceae bacterium]
MKKQFWWIGLAFGLLAACVPAGGPPALTGNPNDVPGGNPNDVLGGNPGAMAGFDADEIIVDGLAVGHRLMAAGEYELALTAYLRAAASLGMTADVLSALGSANLRLGRLGQAEQLLRRAVKADPKFAPAWNNLGVVLMEQGNFAEAERVFRTAFALDSGESAEIRNNLLLALEILENPAYSAPDNNSFALVRQ